ncbi:hypothetical protein LSCM1_02452 [Leishmania martiniquensis]|uniref:Uncharacterized protein n=1 Tax=Leishmania martiniquensis TaxID=1580590 RepID=A0A836KDH9_9TRYP|nr:hypothetical protein LSCM1_02452 [Leishmania martiniquensis]
MESKVISLLTSRPLLTVAEAAMQIGVPKEDLQPIFTSIAASHEGVYMLLSRSVEEAANGSATAMVMHKVNGLEADPSVDALLSLAYPSKTSPSSLPVQLYPSVSASLRAYPVVSRTVMENRPEATPSLSQELTAWSAAVSPVSGVGPREAELAKREGRELASTPSSAASLAASTVLPSPPSQEESPQSYRAPMTAAAVKAETTPRSPSPARAASTVITPAASPKATIFDKMTETAAAKRPRTEEAPAKPMRHKRKPGKVVKLENTTSLAKLARASKKKIDGVTGAKGAASAPSSMSFLDDDDGDARTRVSHSEGSSSHVGTIVNEDSPVFDVVEVPASNDEVIMCDDVPPLAFRPAAPLSSPATPISAKRELDTKKACSAAAEPDVAQCRLGHFFHPSVVQFQKSYVRQVQTETRMDDGEYICRDVSCYIHSATGEVISEDEYHQRTAAFIRSNSHDAAGNTPPQKAASATIEAPSRMAAAPKVTVRGGAPQKSEKTIAAPARTLLSFFRPSST